MTTIRLWLSLAVLAILAGVGQARGGICTDCGQTDHYDGPPVSVGNGRIHSWMTVDDTGHPNAIGVTFTAGVLTNLPATDTEYLVPLPPQAAATGVPITQFVLNWNPHGHVPTNVYGVPHFDFHFYTITPAVRQAITATGDNLTVVDRDPMPMAIPQGYIRPPGTEMAHEGAHWINPASPEFNGHPFTETFIYGFYDGQLAFFEPMITRDYLETHPSVSHDIALPQAFPRTAYWPTGYRITSGRNDYTVALTGLVWR